MERVKGLFKTDALPDLVMVVGCVSLILVCLFLLAVPAFHHLQSQACQSAVKGNAMTLQLAAESYAASHQGQYPLDPIDLVPYLPGDTAPENPYTHERMSFKIGAGDLTYRSPTQGQDYIIEAWAADKDREPYKLLVLKGKADRR